MLLNEPSTRSCRFWQTTSNALLFSSFHWSNDHPKSPAKTHVATNQNQLGRINAHFSARFNGLLVNKYTDGEDYISSHSDDERGLDPSIGVLVISWGAERTFRLRHNGNIVHNAQTKPYYALLMAGSDFQAKLKHEIPRSKRVTMCRVSFTWRVHHNKANEEQLYKAWQLAQEKKALRAKAGEGAENRKKRARQ